MKRRVMLLCTAFLLNEIYIPTKFLVDTSCTCRVMSRTNSMCKNEQRVITPKYSNAELQFLCSALLLNEIYLSTILPTKFYVDTCFSCRIMSKTRECRWTDVRTDKVATSGSIIIEKSFTSIFATIFGKKMKK